MDTLLKNINNKFTLEQMCHSSDVHSDSKGRIWFSWGDAVSGHLKQLGVHPYQCRDWRDFSDALLEINELKSKKIILVYNGFDIFETLMLANFLYAVWSQKKQLKFDLDLFILPESYKDRNFADNNLINEFTDLCTANNFKAISFNRKSRVKLKNWQSYIDYAPIKQPIFDLSTEKFDLPALYDLCCKHLAYILKREIIFPMLSTGMTYLHTAWWMFDSANQENIFYDFSPFSLFTIENYEILNLWKLLKKSSLKNSDDKNIDLSSSNIFSRSHTFDQFDVLNSYCETIGYIPKAVKSDLALTIANKTVNHNQSPEKVNDLFPLSLFLGHYRKYGKIECLIPEYNFHELIQALTDIIKGRQMQDLLPDIPGEKVISLEAYRRGYIRLSPMCTTHYWQNNTLIADFKNKDAALNFLAIWHNSIFAKVKVLDTGRVIFGNIVDLKNLLNKIKNAEKNYCEYKINMWMLDGNTPRKMSLQEILEDSAAKIVNYFEHDAAKALEYLHNLHEQFKDDFKRFSAVE